MSVYAALLELAELQAAARERGDLEAAIQLLDARATLLDSAPQPTSNADRDNIAAIMRLDRELSSAIRQRMVEIRDEVAEGTRGHRALGAYRPFRGARAHWVQAER